MDFKFCVVLLTLSFVAASVFSKPVPDSAGIAPLPKGLAYGGIPYGSISGQLSLFYGEYEPVLLSANKISGNEVTFI